MLIACAPVVSAGIITAVQVVVLGSSSDPLVSLVSERALLVSD